MTRTITRKMVESALSAYWEEGVAAIEILERIVFSYDFKHNDARQLVREALANFISSNFKFEEVVDFTPCYYYVVHMIQMHLHHCNGKFKTSTHKNVIHVY